MKNADGSHSHQPIDHDPRKDIPPQTGEIDTQSLTRDLETAIELAMFAKLRRIAVDRSVSLRRAVPFLIAELRA